MPDGNGSISANELGSIMRKMGIDASDAELKVRDYHALAHIHVT